MSEDDSRPDAGTTLAKPPLAATPQVMLRQRLAVELGLSPDLPGEVIIVAAVKAVSSPEGPRGPALEELAEDCRSFNESMPYFIRRGEMGDPIACECCGTAVAKTPEALGVRGPWRPGIWEPETARRHTLRRCEWKRANP